MKEILDIIHNTIYQFFDVCGDDEEVPMSDKDKLLLEVNKAICNNLKALDRQPKTGHWIVSMDCEGKTRQCTCNLCGYETGKYTWKNPNFCEDCGAKMVEPQESEGRKMFNCDYRIYDNYEEKWDCISFADFEDAEDHVIFVLEDADLERYSIYKRICGQ